MKALQKMIPDAEDACISDNLKMAPGVDFTNILCSTFKRANPKSAKKTDD